MAITPLPIGGKLRFAAGSPNTLRSATWMVVGGTNGRDVYVSMRSLMNELKFSLHASGNWRVAMTSESGIADNWVWEDSPFRSADEDPRVVTRLAPPPEVDGWRQALDIVVSEPGLQQPFSEKRVKGGAISWWRPPFDNWVRTFAVLISRPGLEYNPRNFPFTDPVVGAINLPGRSSVVVITKLFYRPWTVEKVREVRRDFENAGWRQDGADSPLLFKLGTVTTTVWDLGLDPLRSA